MPFPESSAAKGPLERARQGLAVRIDKARAQEILAMPDTKLSETSTMRALLLASLVKMPCSICPNALDLFEASLNGFIDLTGVETTVFRCPACGSRLCKIPGIDKRVTWQWESKASL